MTAGVIFRAELNPHAPRSIVNTLNLTLGALGEQGWRLSPHESVSRSDPFKTRVYWSAPYQDIDAFGVFEATNPEAAHRGVTDLQHNGWDQLFQSTEWLIGPRDLDPDPGNGPHNTGLGFLALWDWNDPWHAATHRQRADYDTECDVAFHYDTRLGIDLFGRFACHATGGWEHVAIWEVPDLHTLTAAMGAHETQRDFMYTTSAHYIGRPIPFTKLEDHLS